MCDDKYSSRSVVRFPQYSVWWIQMDKIRPVVVVSNNWFNTYSNGILVASMTTTDYDDRSDKEYSKLIIPIVGINKQRSSINLGSLRFIDYAEMENLSSDRYVGFITDIMIQKKITELMSGVFVPEFNSYFTTSDFIINQGVTHNGSDENIKIGTRSIEEPDKKKDSKNFVISKNRIVSQTTSTKPTSTNRNPISVQSGQVDQTKVSSTNLRSLIANRTYDVDAAIDFYKVRGILDDADLIVNFIAYIADTPYTEVSNKLGVTNSSVVTKATRVIAHADMKQYLSPDEIAFVRNRIRERKRS